MMKNENGCFAKYQFLLVETYKRCSKFSVYQTYIGPLEIQLRYVMRSYLR